MRRKLLLMVLCGILLVSFPSSGAGPNEAGQPQATSDSPEGDQAANPGNSLPYDPPLPREITLSAPGPGARDEDCARIIREYKEGGESSLEALRNLGIRGCTAAPVLQTLTECLSSNDDEVVLVAMEALGKIGPSAGSVERDLLELLGKSDNQLIGLYGIVALGKIHSDPESALPYLSRVIEGDERGLLQPALNAAVRFGPAAAPMLESALKNASGDKKQEIQKTLDSLKKKR